MTEVKKVSLSDLGAVLPPVQNASDAIAAPTRTIIRPDQVGGLNTDASNIGDIAAYTERVEPEKEFEKKQLDLIDEGIERVKADLLENVINPLKDKVLSEKLEAEAEGIDLSEDKDLLEIVAPTVNVKPLEKEISDKMDLGALQDMARFDIDDSDLKDLMEDDEAPELTEEDKEKAAIEKKEDEAAQKETWVKYQGQIKEVIKPVSDFNLKEFRISTKPIAVTHALKKATVETKTAQWALYNTKQVVTFSALSGDEIVNLNPDNFETELEAMRTAYSILYNHDISPNKPSTLEAWLKSICGYDEDELYFAAYKATFGHSNYITYACELCKELDLRDADIEQMVRYPSEEFKAKYKKLLTTGDTSYPSLLESQLVPVSDEYAFSFRAPSLYGMYFESSALDKDFVKKYADILSILAFIDGVYYIDAESKTLVPIDCKPVPGNISKTVRNKVVAYYNIIKKLTADQYTLIGTEVNKIGLSARRSNIIYQLPEADCAGTHKKTKIKCTHHFPATPTPPLQMLFTRHQLVAIANYSNEQE